MSEHAGAPGTVPNANPNAVDQAGSWATHAINKLDNRFDVVDCKLDAITKAIEEIKAEQQKAHPELRERAVRLDTKLEGTASKAELLELKSGLVAEVAKLINDQTWKYLSVAATVATLAFLAARFIKVG